ncbi:MAG: hypothetical protein K0M45_01990 [Candidatus Paracaedibacteraceae bacterium]|nr:hypothetical protein [Candidatus Paracaedibacteraceae bacterium]
MVFNIQKFSLLGPILLLTNGATEALAMEYGYPSASPYTSRRSYSDNSSYISPAVSLKNKPSADTRPSIKNKKMKSENMAFKETSKGIYEVLGDQLQLTPEKFKSEIELLLKNPEVTHVLIDSRNDYNHNGDKIIRSNLRLVRPWYKSTLENSSLTKKEIYKLVWLPKEKVMDDLMNQGFFWPEEWLFSMKDYYNTAHTAS